MKSRKLTSLYIAYINIRRRPFRTFSLMTLVAVLSFVLFGGSVLSSSLSDGAKSLSQRLGADAMVVPVGYDSKIQGALLKGEPSTFYMSDSWVDIVSSTDGVEAVSPQVFIASFSEECCSLPVQLIGFEPASDFVIQPWLQNGTSIS